MTPPSRPGARRTDDRPPEPPRLSVSHDKDFHWLIALEYGRVGEDQPQEHWHVVSEDVAFLLDAPGDRVLGFRMNAFHEFDPDDPELAPLRDAPRFDVPTLGLANVTAGEIALAARAYFGDRDSLNRVIFSVACQHEGEESLRHWQACGNPLWSERSGLLGTYAATTRATSNSATGMGESNRHVKDTGLLPES